MDAPVPAVPRWRSFPPEVVAAIEARRTAVLARVPRPLLDLDDAASRARLHATDPDHGSDAGSERFASILGTAALVDEPDLVRSVRALSGLLADDGELHLIEPVGRPGLWGLLVASAGAALPAVAGLHLSRDVVGAVRAAGLTAADVDRFEIATRVWPLRRFVELRAVRIPHVGHPPTGHATEPSGTEVPA